jgi:integral membrane protein
LHKNVRLIFLTARKRQRSSYCVGVSEERNWHTVSAVDRNVETPPVLQRLRWIGYAEGTSFLLLLLIAMPLKYLAGLPSAVMLVGMAHGVLWLLFLAALGHAAYVMKWPFIRLAAGFVASVLPFGPFVFDSSLRKKQAA